MVKSCMVALMIVVLCSTTCLAQQGEKSYTTGTTNPSETGEMLIDIVFLRPLGVAATVFGTVAFVVSLPVTLITHQTDKAAQKLIVAPGEYTFTRPLGEID